MKIENKSFSTYALTLFMKLAHGVPYVQQRFSSTIINGKGCLSPFVILFCTLNLVVIYSYSFFKGQGIFFVFPYFLLMYH